MAVTTDATKVAAKSQLSLENGYLVGRDGARTPIALTLLQATISSILPQSSSVGTNGALTYGSQIGGGTATFGATSGSTTVTLSLAGLLGTVADVGRVITVDGGKQFTITTHSTTTLATGTISGGPLSGLGPFATWQLAWPLPANGVYPQQTYHYFPVGAVFAGSAAGWYYTVMNSATLGVIYGNTYSGVGMAVVPAVPTPIVAAGPGAFTQTTGSMITTSSVIMPGGLLGINGSLRYESYMFGNQQGSASRFVQTAFGGNASNTSVLLSSGAIAFARQDQTIANMGSLSRQAVHHAALTAALAGTSNSGGMFNTNTAVDQVVANQVQLTTATDYIGQYWLRLTAIPGV